MTASPLTVSVVIPAKDAAEFLAAAIASALTQTHPVAEVVVADDGSVDDTLLVARRQGDPRVRVIEGGPSNAGAARNRAIRGSTGSVVAFLDADDVWYPEKLATQLEVLSARPELAGVGALFSFRMRERVFGVRGELLDEEKLERVRQGLLMPLTFSSLIVRRRVLDEVGLFDESLPYGEDLELLARLAIAGDLVVLDQVLGEYRLNPGGLSRNNQVRNQRYTRFVEERTAARGAGGDLSWDEFVAQETPLTRRDELRFAAARAYQEAGRWYVSRKYVRAALSFAASLIRDPGYTISKLRGQRLWVR